MKLPKYVNYENTSTTKLHPTSTTTNSSTTTTKLPNYINYENTSTTKLQPTSKTTKPQLLLRNYQNT